MMSQMLNQRKTPILDSYSNGNRASSLLRCNNVLNRLNCSMNHKALKKSCVFEQFKGLLFSDLSGPLRRLNS